MRLRQVAAGVGLALALAFAAACGGDDDENDDGAAATSTPPAPATRSPQTGSPTPGVSATPGSGLPTGIDSIDMIGEAVSDGDTDGLSDLVLFRQVACTTVTGQGPGGPPACREGEAEGTEVLVVLGASCEGYYAREDELPFQRIALGDPAFYAAYRIDETSSIARGWPDAKYAVVLNRIGGGAVQELALAVFADDEGIVGFSEGCGETPAQWVVTQGLTDEIVAPE